MKRMISPTLLVLAAGMGNRYGGLKQIEPVGPVGETIVEYSIYDAIRAGFGKVVFVIRKDIEHQFREAVGTRLEKHIAVEHVFQELDKVPSGFSVPVGRIKPWGTAHAILMAADAIDEPFAVINADDFYGAEGYRVLSQHLQTGAMDYAMVGFVLRNTLSHFGPVSRGICQVSGDGFLQSIGELENIECNGLHARNIDIGGKTTRLSGDEMVSMNMWGFTPEIFEQLGKHFKKFLEQDTLNAQSESYLPVTVNELISTGQARVKVLRTDGAWSGITYRGDRPRVVETISRLIDRGDYPQRLWA
jgi:hypothetical protein